MNEKRLKRFSTYCLEKYFSIKNILLGKILKNQIITRAVVCFSVRPFRSRRDLVSDLIRNCNWSKVRRKPRWYYILYNKVNSYQIKSWRWRHPSLWNFFNYTKIPSTYHIKSRWRGKNIFFLAIHQWSSWVSWSQNTS